MRIAAIASLAVLALFAGATQAQVYCWTTKDGKKACGDTPPPGVKPAAIATPQAPSAPAPESGAKAGKKPADPEQEYKKRQMEAQKSREKEQQAQEQTQAKQENCERARSALRILESGQRISRVDKDGERYFLEDKDIEAETQRARDSVTKNCT
jgi:outer membrane biosynthesis protein TonB